MEIIEGTGAIEESYLRQIEGFEWCAAKFLALLLKEDTDHVGLYEKYGFEYLDHRLDVWGEDSRIYHKTL